MACIPESLETRQVLDIVRSYTAALDLLDDYDHQRIGRPKQGAKAVYELSYDECISVIKSMRFGAESDLFGVEKDDSFKSSIGNIYQTFGGRDIYPTLQEKAANLLYFVVKNHSFLDGNKRIAATVFLYFLDRNDALFVGGRKSIDDSTLVAVTVMIAESKSEEKDAMVALVMNFLVMGSGGLSGCWPTTRTRRRTSSRRLWSPAAHGTSLPAGDETRTRFICAIGGKRAVRVLSSYCELGFRFKG